MKTLLDGPSLVPVNALLLAERGAGFLNPIELITDGEKMWVEAEGKRGNSGFRAGLVSVRLIESRPQPDLPIE